MICLLIAVSNIGTLQPGSAVQLGALGQLTKIQTVSTPPGPAATSGSGVGVPTVDLTEGEDDRADTREIVFNKLSGKTFPSLVVLARPSLRTKDAPVVTTTKERAAMGKSTMRYDLK
jgi:hypothetical protein